jgi:hypothetical protein
MWIEYNTSAEYRTIQYQSKTALYTTVKLLYVKLPTTVGVYHLQQSFISHYTEVITPHLTWIKVGDCIGTTYGIVRTTDRKRKWSPPEDLLSHPCAQEAQLPVGEPVRDITEGMQAHSRSLIPYRYYICPTPCRYPGRDKDVYDTVADSNVRLQINGNCYSASHSHY